MRQRISIVLLVMLIASIKVHADIIALKDGKMINARIIEQDERKMKVEENGEVVTYFKDQIKSVNGQPLTSVIADSKDAQDVKAVSVPAAEEAKLSGLSKRALIRKFIDIFGTRESMNKNFENMIATLPPDKAQEVRKILNVDEVIDNIMPLYDKYFTQEDLEGYVAFFSSEQGQKFLKALPLIMKESVDVNIEYFKTKMPEEFK